MFEIKLANSIMKNSRPPRLLAPAASLLLINKLFLNINNVSGSKQVLGEELSKPWLLFQKLMWLFSKENK